MMRGMVLAIAVATAPIIASGQDAALSPESRPPARPAQEVNPMPAGSAEDAAGVIEAPTPEAAVPVEPDDTRPAERPEAAAAAPPPPPAQSQPEDAAPAEPATPSGPAIRETLRESDFDYSACLLALHDLGTEYEEIAPLQDAAQSDCGIARPILVSQIMPGIALQGGAPMRCETARALGFWIRDFVRPAAARLPGAPRLNGMQLGTTYDCRGRVGGGEAPKLSEHAFGNAIDIAAFTFHSGAPIPVTPRQDTGDLVESFQRAVRGAACLYFTTVLGPGSNAAHDDHLHLDIAARNGGWRLCQ